MTTNPLEVFEQLDPALLRLVRESKNLAVADGVLPKKVKLLIALALDAAHGTISGVKSLTLQALEAGASKEEIMETLRVAHYIAGAGAIYTAANALNELF